MKIRCRVWEQYSPPLGGNFILRCLQYIHTHRHTHAHRHRNSPCSYVSFNKPHLSPSASPTSSAGPQSSAVTSPASVRLVEVCFLLSPAKRVPINFLLMYFCHIFKKVVRVFIERPQWGGEWELLVELHCCYPLSWEDRNILFSLLGGQGGWGGGEWEGCRRGRTRWR